MQLPHVACSSAGSCFCLGCSLCEASDCCGGSTLLTRAVRVVLHYLRQQGKRRAMSSRKGVLQRDSSCRRLSTYVSLMPIFRPLRGGCCVQSQRAAGHLNAAQQRSGSRDAVRWRARSAKCSPAFRPASNCPHLSGLRACLARCLLQCNRCTVGGLQHSCDQSCEYGGGVHVKPPWQQQASDLCIAKTGWNT